METMKLCKSMLTLCALSVPVSALAGGSATGTISNLFVDASFASVVYVTLTGAKSSNPACSTSTRGQFVIPITAAVDYSYMFNLALNAQNTGASVTITGQNQCNVDNNVETIQNIKIS
jgi:phage tail sheath gpL-like